ncbi:MAG: 30S ribosomal protein S4 [Candidatus Diapherotrites archaeon]|nr:30S ribosomal protein S4 [Candidatus Diapherotrites archaeon]
MGDPRRLRKNYSSPTHPYDKERIEKENQMKKDFGLKNKKEIRKAESKIRNYRKQARALLADRSEFREQRQKDLVNKLVKSGLLQEGATLDDVLGLTVIDILNRRLQTVVFKKGLASSTKQARQFIVHGHIAVNGRRVDVPGYVVLTAEEGAIGYYGPAPKIEIKREHEEISPTEKPKEMIANIPETKPSIPDKEAM